MNADLNSQYYDAKIIFFDFFSEIDRRVERSSSGSARFKVEHNWFDWLSPAKIFHFYKTFASTRKNKNAAC